MEPSAAEKDEPRLTVTSEYRTNSVNLRIQISIGATTPIDERKQPPPKIMWLLNLVIRKWKVNELLI